MNNKPSVVPAATVHHLHSCYLHQLYLYRDLCKPLCPVQVSRLLEWTGHLQTAVQYMASCVRLPSPPAPTSPSSQS